MNHSGRMQRLEDQVREHDPSFRLPHRDESFSMEALEQHLDTATLDLRKIQRSAPEHRMRSLYDLLAFYESGASDVSASEARRRSTGLRSSIRNGTIRGTFSNIRQELKPVEQSGLQHVNIPSAAMDSSDVTPYSFLQQSPADVIWEKVIDRAAIEAQILRYDQESFRAAASSPIGHGLIHDELTFTSLSPTAVELLKGHIPAQWSITDH